MTNQSAPTPTPQRDELGIPRCSLTKCSHFLDETYTRKASCGLTGGMLLIETMHDLCEPQARADAAELVALREKYNTDVLRERRKTDEWSARIVEATEKGLALIAERDAAQVEVARLKVELAAWDRAAREIECREVDAVKRGVVYVLRARVTALTGTTGDAPEKL